jgi:hypothetical protein
VHTPDESERRVIEEYKRREAEWDAEDDRWEEERNPWAWGAAASELAT